MTRYIPTGGRKGVPLDGHKLYPTRFGFWVNRCMDAEVISGQSDTYTWATLCRKLAISYPTALKYCTGEWPTPPVILAHVQLLQVGEKPVYPWPSLPWLTPPATISAPIYETKAGLCWRLTFDKKEWDAPYRKRPTQLFVRNEIYEHVGIVLRPM
jgi:hypothetical protein